MTTKIKTLSPTVISELLRDAWLNIRVNEKTLYNPLEHIPVEFDDNPHIYILWLMQQPEYFSFVCKQVLNVDILPMQSLFLLEMWKRKFPMFIAARGASKSYSLAIYTLLRLLLLPSRRVVICGSVFRQSKIIFNYMEGIWYNAPILRDICGQNSGPRHEPDMYRFHIGDSVALALPTGDGCGLGETQITYMDGFGTLNRFGQQSFFRPIYLWGNGNFIYSNEAYYNGVRPVKLLNTKRGYQFGGTHNHRLKVLEDFEIKWKRLDELQSKDFILIDRSKRWHNGDFECTEDEAYFLGIMMKDKTLPSTILSASKKCMSACLRGLFDTDGHVSSSTLKGGISISVHFTNTSKKLIEQIQYILLHYGIISTVRSRERSKKWNIVYELDIHGKNVWIFAEEIGFGLSRKQNKLLAALKNKRRCVAQDDNIPNIKPLLLYICTHYQGSGFPEINYSKIEKRKKISFNLVAKFLLKYKNVQHPYIDKIIELADPNIYYDTVQSIEDIGQYDTYDLHVPNINEYCANGFYSHNSKIRGQRANDIIADEFAATSKDVFENVIAGFGVVKSSPLEAVQERASIDLAKKIGTSFSDLDSLKQDNQLILSGTAYYDFNHFADYWKRWKAIIKSKGDIDKLAPIFGDDGVPEHFNWKDYSIIRLPFELVPKGFMDEAMVARSKATIHSGIYAMEFGSVFSTDSNGFFKRTLIESCVLSHENEIMLPSGRVDFTARTKGDITKKYVYGIDPASEVDNFSIIILEHYDDHRRIVYCWTTNRTEHRERVKAGIVKETDFYSYCARKIRELMITFPCERIAMDAQGGGIAVMEALHDKDKMEDGELAIWPVITPGKPLDTDGEPGLHILEMIQFASATWTSEANHGLRKDFEDKVCIFPRFDKLTLGLAEIDDDACGRIYDTLEGCLLEIEELKNELSTIIITQTAYGRDRWDTPEIKLPGNKKGRLRKDRYSSLVMANMVSRQLARNPAQSFSSTMGGFASAFKNQPADTKDYVGPAWLTDALRGIYD